MITNFEHETAPLSEYEEGTLLPLFVSALSRKIGRDMSVTNKEITARLKTAGYKIDSARVRKIINHIRVHGLVYGLIGTSEGYYIATSEKELEEYEDSLKGREEAIRAVRLSISRQRAEMFAPVQPTLGL